MKTHHAAIVCVIVSTCALAIFANQSPIVQLEKSSHKVHDNTEIVLNGHWTMRRVTFGWECTCALDSGSSMTVMSDSSIDKTQPKFVDVYEQTLTASSNTVFRNHFVLSKDGVVYMNTLEPELFVANTANEAREYRELWKVLAESRKR